MANRYTRVFSQDKSLYTETSPVIIIAGALLKDEQTGNIIAQLKFKSISEKMIKAIKVNIIPHDTSGEVCGEEIDFSYLDLTINRDDEFGSKEPILMANPNTRAFSLYVKEVVFTDSTKWNSEGHAWTPIDFNQRSIAEVFSEQELAKQYQITFGSDCGYKPVSTRDLWICSCQAINRSNEESCHKCNNSLFSLENYDLEQLKNEMANRLEKEAQKEKEKAIEQEKLAKKRKRGVIIGLVIAILIIIVAIVASTIRSTNAKKDSILGDWELFYYYSDSDEGYTASFYNLDEYSISFREEKEPTGGTYYMAYTIIDPADGYGDRITDESAYEYIKEENGAQYYGSYNFKSEVRIITVTDLDKFKSTNEYKKCDYIEEENLLYVSGYGTSNETVLVLRKK